VRLSTSRPRTSESTARRERMAMTAIREVESVRELVLFWVVVVVAVDAELVLLVVEVEEVDVVDLWCDL
jgi:hypothetical protein